MTMEDLGLSGDQERVYRYLLRCPGAGPDAVAADAGVAAVPQVLGQLRDLGLLDRQLAPLPPAAAVDLLIRRRIETTSRELARLDSAFDTVRALAEEVRRGSPVDLGEHLTGAEEISRRIESTLNRVETMNAKPLPITLPLDEESARRNRRRLADGMISRTLVGAAALRMPEQMAYARAQHRLGDLHRTTSQAYLPLLILDRKVAFVRLRPDSAQPEALMVRQPGLVAALIDLFERMWAGADDIEDRQLTPTEQRVLRALAEHDKDETAARAVQMSLRKYRAHVAELMARLGAGTRFQAALRAKERGWL